MLTHPSLGTLIAESIGDRNRRLFAKSINVSRGTLQSWMNGARTPSRQHMQALARELAWTDEQLLLALELASRADAARTEAA